MSLDLFGAEAPAASSPRVAGQVRASGAQAVMASRLEAADSAELFPTPPWMTRALFVHVLSQIAGEEVFAAREPCCGHGHMAAVIDEFIPWPCSASDLYDYGYGQGGVDALSITTPSGDYWWITNPPFRPAAAMAKHALTLASGVALLLRTQWIEGVERYNDLFSWRAPCFVAPFVERGAMVKGRWDPDASAATSYTWFVWSARWRVERPNVVWIPPGTREALTKPDDRARFAAWSLNPSSDAELEEIARRFCAAAGQAREALIPARKHATLTYPEARRFKPDQLAQAVTVPAWQSFRRAADDEIARRLTIAALTPRKSGPAAPIEEGAA